MIETDVIKAEGSACLLNAVFIWSIETTSQSVNQVIEINKIASATRFRFNMMIDSSAVVPIDDGHTPFHKISRF